LEASGATLKNEAPVDKDSDKNEWRKLVRGAAAEKGAGREESDSERTPRSYVPPTALSIADFEPSANLF
jgi:hypothetical protein